MRHGARAFGARPGREAMAMSKARKKLETKRKRLHLSENWCPKCKAFTALRILRAGRDVAATEGWVEVRCIRCTTVWRVIPVHPDEEARTT
ncbi:hypothetical protein D3C86_1775500 [compost metagenome]